MRLKVLILSVSVLLVLPGLAQDRPTVTATPNTVYVGADGKFETAPDTAARDQPKSRVSGSTKIEKVATAGPCRAKPAQHKHARTIQP